METKNTKYNHIYVRVRSPRGYKYEFEALPFYLSVTVETEGESKKLYVHSRIHVDKKVRVGCEYSLDFTDQEIIKDQTGEIHRRFIA